MDTSIIDKLEARLKRKLPGIDAQLNMASDVRYRFIMEDNKDRKPRQSSVLILLYPHNNNINVVLIQRPEYEGVHSGQISFPGGQKEESDKSKVETALREASEEIGIDINKVKIIGMLTDLYIPPSNYLVAPVIGFVEKRPEFIPQVLEVKGIIETPLEVFTNIENKKSKVMKLANGITFTTPYYDVHGHVVWGATAMIISELESILYDMGN